VTLTNTEMGVKTTVNSAATGAYSFLSLAPGNYNVTITASGFQTTRVTGITVSVGSTAVFDVGMVSGSASQTVSVSGASATQQEGAGSSATMSAKDVTAVPLTTRNVTQTAGTTAGASMAVYNASSVGRGSQDAAVNGQSTSSNNYAMDGAVANNWANNTVGTGGPSGNSTGGQPIPQPDAIAEMRSQATAYEVTGGRNSGGSMDMILKNGTNSLHGNLFAFVRNDIFNANAFFVNNLGRPRPNMKQNQDGGTLGGYIIKNKLFWFVAYQYTSQINGLDATSLSNVYLPPLTNVRDRATIGSQFCPTSSLGTKTATYAGGTQVACDGSNINPIAMALLQLKLPNGQYYFPTPQRIQATGQTNAGLGYSAFTDPAKFKENQGVLTQDWLVSKKNTLYLREFYDQVYILAPMVVDSSGTGVNGTPADFFARDHIDVAKLKTQISKNTVNTVRLSYTRNWISSYWKNQPDPYKLIEADSSISTVATTNSNLLGTDGLTHSVKCLASATSNACNNGMTPDNIFMPLSPGLTFSGNLGTFTVLGGTNGGWEGTVVSTIELNNTITKVRGKHTYTFGGNLDKLWWHGNLAPGRSRGLAAFQNFTDFLIGLPAFGETLHDGSTVMANGGTLGYSNVYNIASGTTGGGGAQQGKVVSSGGGTGYRQATWPAYFYFQDNFRATKNLTLTLGIRWEWSPIDYNVNGDTSAFLADQAMIVAVPPKYGTLAGITMSPSNRLTEQNNPYTCVATLGPAKINLSACKKFSEQIIPVLAPQGGLPQGVTIRGSKSLYVNNTPVETFSPRVGFAYRYNNKLSFRGGFGRFHQATAGQSFISPGLTLQPFAHRHFGSGQGVGFSALSQVYQYTTLGFRPRVGQDPLVACNTVNANDPVNFPLGYQTPCATGTKSGLTNLNDAVGGPEYRIPTTDQWSFGLDYQLPAAWTVSLNYVGSRGFNTSGSVAINQDQIASPTNKVNCGYDGDVTHCLTSNKASEANLRVPILGEGITALANSQFTSGTKYHGVTVSARHRMARGFTFGANYTYSKSMSDGTTLNDQTLPGPFARQSSDRTHRMTLNGTYTFPTPKTFGALNTVLSGWMLGMVSVIQAGTPLTMTDSRLGTIYGPATTVSALLCPGKDPHAIQNKQGGVRDRLYSWFDQTLVAGTATNKTRATSCFGSSVPAATAAYLTTTGLPISEFADGYGTLTADQGTRFGNIGQDVATGPGQFNWDLALSKNTKVGGINENGMVQFRMEMYNMFNHAQFGNPGVAANSASGFGVISSTTVSPRMIQFALKYMF